MIGPAKLKIMGNDKIIGIIVAITAIIGAGVGIYTYKSNEKHKKVEEENLALQKKNLELDLAIKQVNARKLGIAA